MPNYPHIDPSKPLMVIADTSVLLHKIHQSTPMAHTDPQFESAIRANLTWLMSGAWLGYELRPLMRSMVFVRDVKQYWRVDWLLDIQNTLNLPRKTKALTALAEKLRAVLAQETKTLEDIEFIDSAIDRLNVKYKAGRKFPTAEFTKIRKLTYRYLDQLGANQLGLQGYEADDMAAAVVQTNTDRGNPYNILLLTVDTDWLGLVNPNTTWCCMTGFKPVIRDTIEVCNSWVEVKLNSTLTTWRDIWDIKAEKGDASDNLPRSAGQLLPVIDLLNPPARHKVWKTQPDLVSTVFTDTDPAFTLDEAKAAQNHLRMLGLQPVNKLLPNETLDAPVLPDYGDESIDEMMDLLDQLKTVYTSPEGVF